jgi:hypothetical protein
MNGKDDATNATAVLGLLGNMACCISYGCGAFDVFPSAFDPLSARGGDFADQSWPSRKQKEAAESAIQGSESISHSDGKEEEREMTEKTLRVVCASTTAWC